VGGALDTYNARTRRLLTDGGKQYWSDHDLTDHINQARVRVAGDTKCLRQLITGITLPQGQEAYNIVQTVNAGTPPLLGPNVVEVIGVTIYWGNMRVKCINRPWTEQDAKLRIFQTYITRPGSVAMMGANTIYLNPVPDQNYNSDWDVVVVPPPLMNSSDMEVLPVVFQTPVPYYAAHLAKYTEQSMSESDIFYRKYGDELKAANWAFFGARWRAPYRV
jgi:hypothetical protein